MRCSFTAAALLAAALAGCGPAPPKLVSVTGKVVQKGTGLSAGVVYLHPAPGNTWAGEPPSSQLQLDGSFTLATYPHGNGAPPGEWKVTLSPALAGRIHHPEYGDPAKTPLSLKVPDEGVKDHLFEVK
jgi:hypothetical protein